MNGLDKRLDMYVLYIWTDVSVIPKGEARLV